MTPLIPTICAAALVLSACAESGANYTPILDGAPSAAFQSDLSACQTLARNQRQFDQETAAAAVLVLTRRALATLLGDRLLHVV